jgi:hypothetical protein
LELFPEFCAKEKLLYRPLELLYRLLEPGAGDFSTRKSREIGHINKKRGGRQIEISQNHLQFQSACLGVCLALDPTRNGTFN